MHRSKCNTSSTETNACTKWLIEYALDDSSSCTMHRHRLLHACKNSGYTVCLNHSSDSPSSMAKFQPSILALPHNWAWWHLQPLSTPNGDPIPKKSCGIKTWKEFSCLIPTLGLSANDLDQLFYDTHIITITQIFGFYSLHAGTPGEPSPAGLQEGAVLDEELLKPPTHPLTPPKQFVCIMSFTTFMSLFNLQQKKLYWGWEGRLM
jgi:hypothetical protein